MKQSNPSLVYAASIPCVLLGLYLLYLRFSWDCTPALIVFFATAFLIAALVVSFFIMLIIQLIRKANRKGSEKHRTISILTSLLFCCIGIGSLWVNPDFFKGKVILEAENTDYLSDQGTGLLTPDAHELELRNDGTYGLSERYVEMSCVVKGTYLRISDTVVFSSEFSYGFEEPVPLQYVIDGNYLKPLDEIYSLDSSMWFYIIYEDNSLK